MGAAFHELELHDAGNISPPAFPEYLVNHLANLGTKAFWFGSEADSRVHSDTVPPRCLHRMPLNVLLWQVVTACPEMRVYERGSSDGRNEFLLLASDGLWDVFDKQDAGSFLISQLPVGTQLENVWLVVCGFKACGFVTYRQQ